MKYLSVIDARLLIVLIVDLNIANGFFFALSSQFLLSFCLLERKILLIEVAPPLRFVATEYGNQ
jgi:hypothetical protein